MEIISNLLFPFQSSREDVMIYAAEKIPQLKSRTNPKHSQDSGQQQGKQGKGKKRKWWWGAEQNNVWKVSTSCVVKKINVL